MCVAPQLTPEAMAEAARAGFRSVVNNRPDFEHGPDQPTNAAIEAAAQRRRAWCTDSCPWTAGFQTPEQIAAFAASARRAARGRLLLFCRTGNALGPNLYAQASPR